MLNKEILLVSAVKPPVYVTLSFFGGRNSGTDITWVTPDGTRKTKSYFDERYHVSTGLTCKADSVVQIVTDDYNGSYTAIPTQKITVEKLEYQHRLTFTAFRDVDVTF